MFHVPDWDADGLSSTGSQTPQGTATGKLQVRKSNKKSKKSVSSGSNGDMVNTPSFIPAATFAFDDSDDESRGLSKKAKKRLKEKRRKQRAKSLCEVDDDDSALTGAAPPDLEASEDASVKQKKKRKRKHAEEPVDYLNTDLLKVFQEAGLLAKTSGSQGGKENANSHPQKSKKRKLDPSTPSSQENGTSVDLPTSGKKKRKRKRKRDDSASAADQKKARMSPTKDVSGKPSNVPASGLAEGSPVVEGESMKKKKKRKRNRKKSLTSTDSSATSPGVAQPNTLHTQKSKASVTVANVKVSDKSDNADNAAESQPADCKSVKKRKKKNSKKNKYKHLAGSNGTETSDVEQTAEDVNSHKKSKIASPIPHAGKKECKKDSFKDVVETPSKKKKQKKAKDLKSLQKVQEDLSQHPEPPSSNRKKQTVGKTPETASLAGGQAKSLKKLPATPKGHLPFDKQRLSAILESSTAKSASERVKESRRREAAEPASLKERLEAELSAAHFRYLNEKLYTCRSSEAQKLFKENQDAFQVYHQGFQNQVARWPVNPLDVIIKEIKSRPANMKIADFGCGDAKLAQSVPNKVHSFDLIALNEHVTVCDMAKVPLPDDAVHIAVFCLSLMGTNLVDYLLEANRVLKQGGTLKIAEVTSRLNKLTSFIVDVEKLGFKFENKDVSNNMFILMNFKKKKTVTKDKGLPEITLPPCLYKKR